MYWPTLSCLLLYSVGVLQNSRKLSGQQFNRIDHIFYIWGQPHFYYCGFVIPGVEALVLCSHDKPFWFSFQTHTMKSLMCVFLINISFLSSLWVSAFSLVWFFRQQCTNGCFIIVIKKLLLLLLLLLLPLVFF